MLRRTILHITAFSLFTLAPAAADEVIRACVNPAGQVRIVAGDSCRLQEQSVVWNVQGPQGPQGIPGVPGPSTPGGGGSTGVVTDSNGTEVGRFMNRSGDVLMRAGADAFIVTATRLGVAHAGRLLHQASNCSDTPNVGNVNPATLAHMAQVSVGTAWIPDRSAAPIVLTPGPYGFLTLYSRTIDANGALGPCTAGLSSAITLLPLKAVPLPTFVAPLDVQ